MGTWAGCGPAQSPPEMYQKCNTSLINGHRPVARLPSGGCVRERRRRENRGAAGAEGVSAGGGVTLPLRGGSGEGAVPPP